MHFVVLFYERLMEDIWQTIFGTAPYTTSRYQFASTFSTRYRVISSEAGVYYACYHPDSLNTVIMVYMFPRPSTPVVSRAGGI